MRFVDLCAGLGGFHVALSSLGHSCVFVSEVDEELRHCYVRNFPSYHGPIVGDFRKHVDEVPEHDVLCAGFPCQPFSKSGYQAGFVDRTRGTLFYYILLAIARKRPKFVILENVGNFERHDSRKTWQTVRAALEDLGYHVRGTEHKNAGGPGLLSPLDIGEPHSRGRFFIIASLAPFRSEPFPLPAAVSHRSLETVLASVAPLSISEQRESAISIEQRRAIELWNIIVKAVPPAAGVLPSFPLWSFEWGAKYPFERTTPSRLSLHDLRSAVGRSAANQTRSGLLALLPSYARSDEAHFPEWKIEFIRRNREWFQKYKRFIPSDARRELRTLSPSFQKLEWNVKFGERDLWAHVLQFRPSGIRVKSKVAIPSLVAMTRTQVPIFGPNRRFLATREGLALLGLSPTFLLPSGLREAYRALGNGVHTGVVDAVARQLFRSAGRVDAHSLQRLSFRQTIARVQEVLERAEAI